MNIFNEKTEHYSFMLIFYSNHRNTFIFSKSYFISVIETYQITDLYDVTFFVKRCII